MSKSSRRGGGAEVRQGPGEGSRDLSEENLAAIRKRGGQYLVGTPRRQMKRFEAELLKDDWTQVRADVEVPAEKRRTSCAARRPVRRKRRRSGSVFPRVWRRLWKLWRKTLPVAD